MNIFYLDHDPQKCAEWMVDKHVVKMVVESAQILSTAHRVLDGKNNVLPDIRNNLLYKTTHKNHRSVVWARSSYYNYLWLFQHFHELSKEYTYRYGKVHASARLSKLLLLVPNNIPIVNFTPPPPAMGDEFKIHNNTIDNYKYYYNVGKKHLHKWTKREPPDWITK